MQIRSQIYIGENFGEMAKVRAYTISRREKCECEEVLGNPWHLAACMYIRTYYTYIYSMYYLDTTYCLRHRGIGGRERKGDLTHERTYIGAISVPEIVLGISMSQREFVKFRYR